MSTTKDPRSIRTRRSWRRALALLSVAGLALAACGSDDGGSADDSASTDASGDTAAAGSEAPAGEAPTGEPLKVMTVTTLNAAGPTYENIANTANA